MSQRDSDLLTFYQTRRIEDQLKFYSGRRRQFDRATGQALAISAVVFGFTSATSALAGADIAGVALWSVLATILPATAMALTAYSALYAFEQQSKIYGDAVRAVQAASRPQVDPGAPGDAAPSGEAVAELVRRVEGALRQEQAQWGQLTSQVGIVDETKG